jgi:arsenate reductase
MAEGYARHLGGDRVAVKSAGIVAHGKNPQAIAIMKEDGIDISDQQSTQLTQDMLQWADWVITVCGHADEQCPVLPSGTRKLHWPLEDPAKATGSDEEITAKFREVRDKVKKRTSILLEQLVG